MSGGRPVLPKLRSSASCMSFLHRVSFHSVPFSPPPRRTRRTLRMAALAPPPAARSSGPQFARILRARLRRRGRAFRGGAVRAPDCARARQAEDAPRPSAGLGSFRTGPARAGRGPRGLHLPRTHHTTLSENASQRAEILLNYSEYFQNSFWRNTFRFGPNRRPGETKAVHREGVARPDRGDPVDPGPRIGKRGFGRPIRAPAETRTAIIQPGQSRETSGKAGRAIPETVSRARPSRSKPPVRPA